MSKNIHHLKPDTPQVLITVIKLMIKQSFYYIVNTYNVLVLYSGSVNNIYKYYVSSYFPYSYSTRIDVWIEMYRM